MLTKKLLTSFSTAALLLASLGALAAPFTQAPLPYAKDALAPVIDSKTMDIHYSRHHLAYINNLNAQAETTPELASLSLEQMMQKMSTFNAAVRNNGGGHYNHQLFWELMAPVGKGGEPSAALKAAIERDFGSLTAMQTAFNQAAATRFGSGWAWLIVNKDGKLQVTSTPNGQPLNGFGRGAGTTYSGSRCLGACVLSGVSKSSWRLQPGLVATGKLAKSQRAICCRQQLILCLKLEAAVPLCYTAVFLFAGNAYGTQSHCL
ncbi:superoxide dismutase [Alishewanella longhuensis]